MKTKITLLILGLISCLFIFKVHALSSWEQLEEIDHMYYTYFKNKNWKLYTVKTNTYQFFKSCSPKKDYVIIKAKDNSCKSIKIDDLDDVEIAWKQLLKTYLGNRIINTKQKWEAYIGTNIINYNGQEVFLWDIMESSFLIIQPKELYIWLYSFFIQHKDNVKPLRKYLLLKETRTWKYYLIMLKSNVDELINTLKIEVKRIKDLLNTMPNLVNSSERENNIAKVYKYIVENYKYREDWLDWTNKIYTWMNWILALKNKEWVCNWYANSMYYLLKEYGISSKVEIGLTCSTTKCDNHAWLSIPFKNKKWKTLWRYFDPTHESWVKSSNKFKIGENSFFWKLDKEVFSLWHTQWTFKDQINEQEEIKKTKENIENYISLHKSSLIKNALNWKFKTIADVYFQYPNIFNIQNQEISN